MSLKFKALKLLMKIIRPGAVATCAAYILRGMLRLVPIRKDVAARNLEIALPDVTPEERRRILRQTYDNLVWIGIELIVLRNNPKQVLEWVDVENPEMLDNGVGGILLACHVGNWELAAAWGAQSGHKISMIVRDYKDQGERDIISGMRENAGLMCIPKTEPMTRALGVLKRNEFLAITPDQHGGGEGIMMPLFGLETRTSQGPAVFAYLTKKPIIPVYIRRVAPFRHKMRFGEPIKWENKGNRDDTVLGITKAINAEIEKIILAAPDQWLAQHKRFKEHY